MGAVDRSAIEVGLSGPGLMERAGAAVAASALEHWPGLKRGVILCGLGNNGGDGHVIARYLAGAGVPVERFGMTPKKGTDAAWAYDSFPGAIHTLADYQPEQGDLVIDALFGAGLDRAVSDEIAQLIERVELAKIPVLAVDLPSGLSGYSGRPTGPCFRAQRTVTFAALKTGHVLLPGRDLCGELEVADIGIPAAAPTGAVNNARVDCGADDDNQKQQLQDDQETHESPPLTKPRMLAHRLRGDRWESRSW